VIVSTCSILGPGRRPPEAQESWEYNRVSSPDQILKDRGLHVTEKGARVEESSPRACWARLCVYVPGTAVLSLYTVETRRRAPSLTGCRALVAGEGLGWNHGALPALDPAGHVRCARSGLA
jgi:hypothetical protein